MSTRGTGRLVDEDGTVWEGLAVELLDADALIFKHMASLVTDNTGMFMLEYGPDTAREEYGPRAMDLIVRDKVRRELLRQRVKDVAEDDLSFGDLTIRRADATGWLVTNGSGEVRFLSQGNAVSLLVDRDGFEHAA